MVKFVWLEVGDGARVPVNPDQVRYLKRTREGKTAIVFSAMPGGFDELVIEMDAAAAVAALEAAYANQALGALQLPDDTPLNTRIVRSKPG